MPEIKVKKASDTVQEAKNKVQQVRRQATPENVVRQVRSKGTYKSNGKGWLDRTLEGVDDVLTAPQKAATWAVTGKYQRPSEAMGLDPNSLKGIAADAVLDPVNILPGIGALGKFTKAGKLAAKAAKVAEAAEKVGKLRKLSASLEGASNVGKVLGKAKYAAKGKVINIAKAPLRNWKGITALTNDVLQPASDGKSAVANSLERVDKVASAPQKKTMKVLTGKEQRPSEYLKLQDKIDGKKHPYLKKAAEVGTDIVLDPMVAVGSGIKVASKVGRVAGKVGGVLKAAQYTKDIEKSAQFAKEAESLNEIQKANEFSLKSIKRAKWNEAEEGLKTMAKSKELTPGVKAHHPTQSILIRDEGKLNQAKQALKQELTPNIKLPKVPSKEAIKQGIKTVPKKAKEFLVGGTKKQEFKVGDVGYEKAAQEGERIGASHTDIHYPEPEGTMHYYKDGSMKAGTNSSKNLPKEEYRNINKEWASQNPEKGIVEPIYETTTKTPPGIKVAAKNVLDKTKKAVTDKVLGKPIKREYRVGDVGYENASKKGTHIGNTESNFEGDDVYNYYKDGSTRANKFEKKYTPTYEGAQKNIKSVAEREPRTKTTDSPYDRETQPIYETTSRNPPKLSTPKSIKTLAKVTPAHLIPTQDSSKTPEIDTNKGVRIEPKIKAVTPDYFTDVPKVSTPTPKPVVKAAPTKKVEPIKPSIKVAPKEDIPEVDVEKPTELHSADTTSATTPKVREVRGFNTIKTASGHYKVVPKSETTKVAKSAIQSGYKMGTKGIKVKTKY